MRHVLLIPIILVLSSCASASHIQPTNTPEQLITEQDAVAVALKVAAMPGPELNGAQVPPTNVRAEQMTFAKAVQQLHDSAVWTGYDPQMPVWVVTMNGIWTDGMPRPTDVPTPAPYHWFAVILDARTGTHISSASRP